MSKMADMADLQNYGLTGCQSEWSHTTHDPGGGPGYRTDAVICWDDSGQQRRASFVPHFLLR